MPIVVRCKSCGKKLKAPDSAAGKRAKCPGCGKPVKIPERVLDAEDVPTESDAPGEEYDGGDFDDSYGLAAEGFDDYGSADLSTDDRKPCPMCGEMIVATAVKCRYCGEVFDAALKRRSPATRGKGSIERQVEEALREKQDKDTALQLFITGLFGCFAPILAIYGIVFLLRRPYDFSRKGLAIAGTVLHCVWTGLLILSIVIGEL